MSLPASAAIWLFFPALIVGLWAAWSDMKFMRIPNQAVLALALAFVVIGPLALPMPTYLWQLAHLPIVLAVGFVMNLAGLIGAGDAKFAAAMAPYFALGDLKLVLALFSAVLLAAFVAHRGLGLIPVFRRAAGDWESWQRRDFPMGLALGAALIFYLALAIGHGA